MAHFISEVPTADEQVPLKLTEMLLSLLTHSMTNQDLKLEKTVLQAQHIIFPLIISLQ